jgi:hypothetical protein
LKKDYLLHGVFFTLKTLTIIVAGILNIIGMIMMVKGYVNWDSFIIYSIFFLGGTIVTSFIASIFHKKMLNKSLTLFLESKGMKENVEILRKTDKALLISFEGIRYTVYIEKSTSEGIGYIIAPAETTIECSVVNWDETVKEKEIKYLAGWEKPVWKEKI